MTAKQLFSKTKAFCMAKLVLGGATVLIAAVLLAMLVGIGWLFGNWGMVIGVIIWFWVLRGIRLVMMHYGGYLIKAGHVAVIAEAMKTGVVPDNQIEYGKELVKQRFATSNVYFAIDKLVAAAIKQIQRGIQKVENALDFIPGIETAAGLANFFVEISLGYVDECCLGWTFYCPEQNVYKSAADGVVIYAQNWKVLLKNAAMTVFKTIVGMIVIVLLIFIPVGLLFKLLKWSGLVAFLLACLIAWTVKFAFLDSYIMCQMMAAYMQAAPQTELTIDIYGSLCSMSASFKELFQTGQKETGEEVDIPVQEETLREEHIQEEAVQQTSKPVFCGQCGAKNERGSKFCGSCGAPMQ